MQQHNCIEKPNKDASCNKTTKEASYFVRKRSISPPQIFRLVYFTHPTIKLDFLLPKLSKTGQITPKRFWTVVLSFSFLFISAESLKKHRKIIK
jgi:hypothetical protein